MSLFLGIDIGTFESKGVVVDLGGRVLAEARRPHRMLVPEPGWAEHRPEEDWWGDFRSIARELVTAPGVEARAIRGIGTSGIGPCMLPLDADGRPLMNAVLYGVDTRAMAEVAELNAKLGEARLVERCGTLLSTQSVGPKILWLRRHRPELARRMARVTTCQSFLVERLTGAFVIDHYSAASFHPLSDVAALDWAPDLCAGIVDPAMLPRQVWTTAVAGTVTRAAAGETGLAEGTPVIAGTIDAAAEAMSVGVREPGDLMLMYGSTIFVIGLTEERVRDPRLYYAPWLFPDMHACMAGLATAGTLTHWFRDVFARELDRATAFATLTAEAAASPPGARGVVVLPYFSGERTPIDDPLAKGLVFGLDLTHTRGDLFRALLEGIACATAHIVETFAEAGERPRRVVAVGGGTRNPVWLQSTSDLTGLAQTLCRVSTGASYGDAFLAAVGTGHARPEDIASWNPEAGRVAPDPKPAHARTWRIYRELYPRLRDLMHATGAAPR